MRIIKKHDTWSSKASRFLAKLSQWFGATRRTSSNASAWDEPQVAGAMDSERCVEVPWAASAINRSTGLWLDIGFANAESRFWEALAPRLTGPWFQDSYGLDMCEPKECCPLPVYAIADLMEDDLGELPRFKLITCISTLEHIGCDNQVYDPQSIRRNQPFEIQKAVLSKLLAKLEHHGRLLVSLPYGKEADYGWFLQYDSGMIQALKQQAERSHAAATEEKYYVAGTQGWTRVAPDAMKEVEYRHEEKRAGGVVLLEFTVQ